MNDPGQLADDFLLGGGEMGALARSIDWARTPLGPTSGWPQSLRTTVSTCLNSRFPILVWWGPDLVKIYNDAYRPMLGAKHPQSMGAPGRAVWPEIWHIIGPMLEGVMTEGRATWSENQFLPLERHGFPEECYFTFSYSPIREESGGIGGVLCAVTETTGQVIGERRLQTLKELAAETAGAVSAEDACRRAMAQLSKNSADLPYAALYLLDGERTTLELIGSAGLAAPSTLLPRTIDVTPNGMSAGPFARALDANAGHLVDSIALLVDAGGGTAALPAERALLIPIHAGEGQPTGVLVAGLSPNLTLEEKYRAFLELLAGQIGSAISRARAFEQEKRRAEALAEVDRAKSAFFSNVSHEFRTPLTLMLGPTEDALATPARTLSGAALETIYRNELRLLKLVNALLDFSRIESGRMQAAYEATDLAAVTSELASMFRSAVERAGLQLTVECAPLAEPVYIDREMWEKILLNLLSNALKYTLEGEIRVALAAQDGRVELTVRDTGLGIAPADQSRIFERFQRVEGTRGRTQEGSGIGLALVNELVRLNGGTIAVESEPGRGSTFTVTLPLGSAHIPQSQIRSASMRGPSPAVGAAYVQEALRWTPAAIAVAPVDAAAGAALDSHETSAPDTTARVLIADDNADMREYLARVLEPHWSVEAVPDGVAALAAVRRQPPDVILTDVMMPEMGGFALMRTLRADPAAASIPVMMLSALAGEEARVDALQSGADDYLVKPFSARELVARVRTQIMLVRHARERARLLENELSARREAEVQREQLRLVFMQAPTPIVILRGPTHVIELVNPSTCRVWGRKHEDLIDRPLAEALPELRGQVFMDLLDRVYATGEPVEGTETPANLDPAGDGVFHTVYFNFLYSPLRNGANEIDGVFVIASDVTGQVAARNEMDRLRAQAEAANAAKDEFLAMLGHELRNPLAPIVTALQLMRLRDDSSDRERGIIERQVNHLTRLVDDLLDVSRIARGKVILKPERIELAEAIARAIEVASPLLEERRHSLHLHVPQHGLAVHADPQRLRQIISNLLTNAAKYTEPGGRVDVTAEAEAGMAVLRVRDTGVGIEASMLPRIFELFVQEPQSADRAHGGLGLGLTIVRNLVALHGGTVAARSNGLGQGSEFVVHLPMSAAAAAAADPIQVAAAVEEAATEGESLRVLVVDDNLDAAHMLAEVLEAKGHRTRVAHDGLAALRVFEQFNPDLALVDIGLPVMDGYELAQRLRAQSSRVGLIAVTGYGQEADRLRSKAAGFDHHLVKPLDFDLLDAAVAQFQAARG